MPKIPRAQLARAMTKLLREQPAQQQDSMRKVAAYVAAAHLTSTGKADSADALVKDMGRELRQSEGILFAEVKSAFGLTDATREEIKEFLKKKMKVQAVEIDEVIDESLISGVVITTADYQIDLSARNKLRRLEGLYSGGV